MLYVRCLFVLVGAGRAFALVAPSGRYAGGGRRSRCRDQGVQSIEAEVDMPFALHSNPRVALFSGQKPANAPNPYILF